MVLQQLVGSGELRVSDCMLDDNNIVLKVWAPVCLIYSPLEGGGFLPKHLYALHHCWWRFGVVVTRWSRSTRLTYADPG